MTTPKPTIPHLLKRRRGLVERRSRLAREIVELDAALAQIDSHLPAPSSSFKKGSIAAIVIELLTIRPHTRAELKIELRRRRGEDIVDNTLDVILVRFKDKEIIEQPRARGPYSLATQPVARRS